ncbi:MAG: restriction endonuclease subunit S [Negativicoccus massiliensis]|uniref:restriction endonuclease subunit S n=1 Tax=Negativicoccus succinicivorans TaxID=620903 RepID=UPI00290FDAF9|nr:restriction endonuclease subunit S [Negativicoccus succinicivorans]MDU4641604.1 restriction endonuclease subunit S [Negativicoccus massiliensis]MDU5233396.1 restriction endonuclease subunit S [Negativicoccus succinicivorans]MDU5288171.1 restriction endonuclease subunit S [Negativicoccus succinicivorans]MDU6871895.1 restriction endonuclease subunit S [Negativicoccus succinicivorans]
MARKMKSSGIEWIGKIPEDWKVVRLKYISDFYNGFSFDSNDLIVDYRYPVIRIGDINSEIVDLNSALGIKDDFGLAPYLIKDNDILLAMSGATVGKVGFIEKSRTSYINQRVGIIRALAPHFAFYNMLTKSFLEYITIRADGSAQPNISAKMIENFPIAYPDATLADEIANKIKKKTHAINEITCLIKQEIQTLEDYKKSVITEAVTKGLDKNAAMKDSGIEWIGDIPKHWEVIKLKYEAEKIAKGISPKYVEEELTPVINQATFSKGYFDNNLNYCSDKPIGDGLLQKNDVLLATTGGGVLGKCFFFEEDGKYLASTDVAFIRCKDKAVAKFIYYIFSVSYQLFNGIYAKGATNQTHLQMNMLSNMQLPLPSDKELEDIILFLDKMSGKIDDAIAGKQKQLETLEEYKKSLIYEYVTGKKEVAEC